MIIVNGNSVTRVTIDLLLTWSLVPILRRHTALVIYAGETLYSERPHFEEGSWIIRNPTALKFRTTLVTHRSEIGVKEFQLFSSVCDRIPAPEDARK